MQKGSRNETVASRPAETDRGGRPVRKRKKRAASAAIVGVWCDIGLDGLCDEESPGAASSSGRREGADRAGKEDGDDGRRRRRLSSREKRAPARRSAPGRRGSNAESADQKTSDAVDTRGAGSPARSNRPARAKKKSKKSPDAASKKKEKRPLVKPLYEKGDRVYAAWWPESDEERKTSPSWYPGTIKGYKTVEVSGGIVPTGRYCVTFDDGDEIDDLEVAYIENEKDHVRAMKRGLKPLFERGDKVYAAWWDTEGRNYAAARWYPGTIRDYKEVENGEVEYGPTRFYDIEFDDGDRLDAVEDYYIFRTEDYLLTIRGSKGRGRGWIGVRNVRDEESVDSWANLVGWYAVNIDGEELLFSFLSDALRAYDAHVMAYSEGKAKKSDINLPEEWSFSPNPQSKQRKSLNNQRVSSPTKAAIAGKVRVGSRVYVQWPKNGKQHKAAVKNITSSKDLKMVKVQYDGKKRQSFDEVSLNHIGGFIEEEGADEESRQKDPVTSRTPPARKSCAIDGANSHEFDRRAETDSISKESSKSICVNKADKKRNRKADPAAEERGGMDQTLQSKSGRKNGNFIVDEQPDCAKGTGQKMRISDGQKMVGMAIASPKNCTRASQRAKNVTGFTKRDGKRNTKIKVNEKASPSPHSWPSGELKNSVTGLCSDSDYYEGVDEIRDPGTVREMNGSSINNNLTPKSKLTEKSQLQKSSDDDLGSRSKLQVKGHDVSDDTLPPTSKISRKRKIGCDDSLLVDKKRKAMMAGEGAGVDPPPPYNSKTEHAVATELGRVKDSVRDMKQETGQKVNERTSSHLESNGEKRGPGHDKKIYENSGQDVCKNDEKQNAKVQPSFSQKKFAQKIAQVNTNERRASDTLSLKATNIDDSKPRSEVFTRAKRDAPDVLNSDCIKVGDKKGDQHADVPIMEEKAGTEPPPEQREMRIDNLDVTDARQRRSQNIDEKADVDPPPHSEQRGKKKNDLDEIQPGCPKEVNKSEEIISKIHERPALHMKHSMLNRKRGATSKPFISDENISVLFKLALQSTVPRDGEDDKFEALLRSSNTILKDALELYKKKNKAHVTKQSADTGLFARFRVSFFHGHECVVGSDSFVKASDDAPKNNAWEVPSQPVEKEVLDVIKLHERMKCPKPLDSEANIIASETFLKTDRESQPGYHSNNGQGPREMVPLEEAGYKNSQKDLAIKEKEHECGAICKRLELKERISESSYDKKKIKTRADDCNAADSNQGYLKDLRAKVGESRNRQIRVKVTISNVQIGEEMAAIVSESSEPLRDSKYDTMTRKAAIKSTTKVQVEPSRAELSTDVTQVQSGKRNDPKNASIKCPTVEQMASAANTQLAQIDQDQADAHPHGDCVDDLTNACAFVAEQVADSTYNRGDSAPIIHYRNATTDQMKAQESGVSLPGYLNQANKILNNKTSVTGASHTSNLNSVPISLNITPSNLNIGPGSLNTPSNLNIAPGGLNNAQNSLNNILQANNLGMIQMQQQMMHGQPQAWPLNMAYGHVPNHYMMMQPNQFFPANPLHENNVLAALLRQNGMHPNWPRGNSGS